MEKLRFDDLTQQHPSLVDSLKEDRFVREFLQRENLDESVLQRHALALMHYAEVKKQCESCQGLSQCPFSTAGRYDDIAIVDGDFCQSVRKCRYQLQQDEKYGIKKNYLICDLGNEALLYRLDKIDLSEETAYYRSLVQMCRQWIENFPRKGFYFVGNLGTGKSYLAACITNHFAAEGRKVAFVNMPELCSDIKRNVTEEDYVDDLIRAMKAAEVLVLDDIGAENFTAYIRDDVLFTVLDYRMTHSKRTFFTSNVDLVKLTERMSYSQNGQKDETKALRLVERIRALAEVLPLKGTSRRI